VHSCESQCSSFCKSLKGDSADCVKQCCDKFCGEAEEEVEQSTMGNAFLVLIFIVLMGISATMVYKRFTSKKPKRLITYEQEDFVYQRI